MTATTERELRAAILASPQDHEPRIVYADWLSEHGDARGEMIALECAQATDDRSELALRALWQHHGAEWLAADLGVNAPTHRFAYRGGFLESADLLVGQFVDLTPRLVDHPIQTLSVSAMSRGFGALVDSRVLRTVRHLKLCGELEDEAALARLLSSPSLARLDSLTLNARGVVPYQEFPAVWYALERCARLANLEQLSFDTIAISATRARWMAASMPALRRLNCDRALSADSLLAFAESDVPRLHALSIVDDVPPRIGDTAIAQALAAPFASELTALALERCQLREPTAGALSALACAPTLVELSLGDQGHPAVVLALAGCEIPALRSLDVNRNKLHAEHLSMLGGFPRLTALHLERNDLSPAAALAIVEHLPNLERLAIGQCPIGDQGVCTIATAPTSTALRVLDLGATNMGTRAIEAICTGGQLNDLRELVIGNSYGYDNATDENLSTVAYGPFDKMRRLELGDQDHTRSRARFEAGWLSRARAYERRLDLGGQAVPNPKPDHLPALPPLPPSRRSVSAPEPRELDPTRTYSIGESVRHRKYGVGVVVHVEIVRVDVRYRDFGVVRTPLSPRNALIYDEHCQYARGDVIRHPTLGTGIVMLVEAKLICVRLSSGEPELLPHARRL